jgi:hypothetical protein
VLACTLLPQVHAEHRRQNSGQQRLQRHRVLRPLLLRHELRSDGRHVAGGVLVRCVTVAPPPLPSLL